MKLRMNSLCLLIALSFQSALAASLPSLEQMRGMLPQLDDRIRANPKDAKALVGRGFIHQQLGNYDQSIADCSAAISADPSMYEAYCYRSTVYMQLKKYPEALKDDNEVIRLKIDPTSYNNRAACYIAMHQYNKAIEDYSKVLQLDKSSANAYDGLAEISYRTGKFDQAVAYCNRALFLNAHMSEALYFRGKSYEALGKKALAQKDLATARSAGYKPDQISVQISK
jgi:tetratricopeptide (TPR) repeat protein